MTGPHLTRVWFLQALALVPVVPSLPILGVTPANGYSITSLAPTSPESLPFGINNNGQVVGYLFDSGAKWFLYNGSMTNVLSAFTLSSSSPLNSSALGINDSGQIAGCISSVPVRYFNGQKTLLGTLPGYQYGYVQSINNAAQAVGTVMNNSADESQGRAFLNSSGQNIDLGVLPGFLYSAARDINDNGQIAGTSSLGDSLHNHPFIYSNGSMTDLGTLGGTYAQANAINASGAVVGSSMRSGSDWGSVHAFVYRDGVMSDLGSLPGTAISQANDINAFGVVVGTTAIALGQSYYHAFVQRNGTMTDLNSLIDPASGWKIVEATGINNAGQIIAYGTNGTNSRRALLLTPVPEPASLATFSTVALFLLGRRGSRSLVPVVHLDAETH